MYLENVALSILFPQIMPDMQQNITDVVLATAGYDHTIRLWEALSGACLRTIQVTDSINNLAISPDKRVLAAAGMQI